MIWTPLKRLWTPDRCERCGKLKPSRPRFAPFWRGGRRAVNVGNTIQVGAGDDKIRVKSDRIVVAGDSDRCCCGGGSGSPCPGSDCDHCGPLGTNSTQIEWTATLDGFTLLPECCAFGGGESIELDDATDPNGTFCITQAAPPFQCVWTGGPVYAWDVIISEDVDCLHTNPRADTLSMSLCVWTDGDFMYAEMTDAFGQPNWLFKDNRPFLGCDVTYEFTNEITSSCTTDNAYAYDGSPCKDPDVTITLGHGGTLTITPCCP